MNRYSVLGILFVACVVLGLFVVVPVFAQSYGNTSTGVAITITSEGTVEGTNSIVREGVFYTLTGNIDVSRDAGIINAGIAILKDNIIIDGAGYSITAHGGYIDKGVDLTQRKNVTVKNLNINGFVHAFWLSRSSNNIITNNAMIGRSVDGFQTGFWLSTSSNNCMNENSITGFNEYGMLIEMSPNNVITGNVFTDNKIDIYLSQSENNVLKNNQLNSNSNNLQVRINSIFQDVDTSNTIRGRPIYYWVGAHDRAVPLDAGFVALANCTNITIKNLQIFNNSAAILIHSTTNSIISENVLVGNGMGISLQSCTNITLDKNTILSDGGAGIAVKGSNNIFISQNSLSGNNFGGMEATGISLSATHCTITANNITGYTQNGIHLSTATENIIAKNYVTHNSLGIYIYMGGQNEIFQNAITDNSRWGIHLSSSQTSPNNNRIYYNNFINNTSKEAGTEGNLQASNPWYFGPETNIWDNGTVGNYWGDYQTRYPNASEIGDSGIGETYFVVNENNIDRYPLMEPVSIKVPVGSDQEPSPAPSPSPEITPAPLQPTESPTTITVPSPSPTLTATPSPELQDNYANVPVIICLVAIALIAAAFTGIFVYFKKKRHTHG